VPAEKQSELTVYASGEVTLAGLAEACGTADSSSPARLLSQVRDADTSLVTLQLLAAGAAEVKLCSGDAWLATILFKVDAASCALDAVQVCDACAASPESPECVAAAAEYCASNPEDKGCAQLSFVFTRRAAESQSISFHVAKDVESVTFEPSRCSCAEPCGEPAVTLRSVSMDEKVLTVDFEAALGGSTLRVCSGTTQLATVKVTSTASCVFDGPESPCFADACDADPTSEECQLTAAEYCSQSNDTACGSFVPVFNRIAGETYEFVAYGSGDVEIIDAVCDCATDTVATCETSAAKLTGKTSLGEFLLLDVYARGEGVAKICVGGEHAVTVRVSGALCRFEAEHNPCLANACIDAPSS
jgi:hypothetical protein